MKPKQFLKNNNSQKLIKCPNCNYEWKTKSKLVKVTCPSCNLKIPNQKI